LPIFKLSKSERDKVMAAAARRITIHHTGTRRGYADGAFTGEAGCRALDQPHSDLTLERRNAAATVVLAMPSKRAATVRPAIIPPSAYWRPRICEHLKIDNTFRKPCSVVICGCSPGTLAL
jgi:hypothetical protein